MTDRLKDRMTNKHKFVQKIAKVCIIEIYLIIFRNIHKNSASLISLDLSCPELGKAQPQLVYFFLHITKLSCEVELKE